ncbi:hypothetical protein NL108_016124 [Boleophthalmus pectinirostris]|nr:hypothetical protein NL108_016124 [Boleophthalmus pectinirostris]
MSQPLSSALLLSLLLLLLLLLLIPPCQSEYVMVAPSQPIIVSVGSDVTLPCQLEPVKDLRNMVVEWARHDLTPRYVHIRRDGLDFLLDQNSLYLGRTSLSERRLQQGDMSLSLTRVRPSDVGTYTCYMPQTDTEVEVTLLVVSVAPPSVSLTKERSGSPVLRCESRGWYPGPELEWLDSEGTVLLRTEAQRGESDELFTVSSRLSVEQRLGNTFTCRVKQQESGQSREAQLSIADEFLEACSSCSVAWVLFGLVLCLTAAAAAFAVWKFKINKTKMIQNQHKDCEEAVEMLKPEDHKETVQVLRSEEKKHSGDDKLTEYQEHLEKIKEELNSVEEFSEELTGTKDFLMKLKDKINQHIYQLRTDITKKENTKFEKDKKDTIQKMKKKMGEFEGIIKDLDSEMCKIDKLLRKTIEKKGKLEGDVKHFTKLEAIEKKKEKKKEEIRTQAHGDKPDEGDNINHNSQRAVNPQNQTEVMQLQETEAGRTGSTNTDEQDTSASSMRAEKCDLSN